MDRIERVRVREPPPRRLCRSWSGDAAAAAAAVHGDVRIMVVGIGGFAAAEEEETCFVGGVRRVPRR
jgi:hypothetical protein